MMKRKILFVLWFVFAGIGCGYAQSENTVKEGRHWETLYSRGMVVVADPFEEYLSGDTIIDGRHCMKLYVTCQADGVKDRYTGAAYEDNHKVMIHSDDQWALLYDFTLCPGEQVETLGGNKSMVMAVDTIEVKGRRYRRMKMCDAVETQYEGYWIEGIGSDRGFVNSAGWALVGASWRFRQCRDGETVIFTEEDFTKDSITTDVRPSVNSADSDSTMEVYTIEGRKVYRGCDMSRLPQGLYVVKKGNQVRTVMK